MGGHRTKIIKEDYAFVLLSLVLIKQKKSKTKRNVRDVATEDEGCRELTQDGVLPCLAGVGALNCTMMHGQEYARLPWQGAAQLQASGELLLLVIMLNVLRTPTLPKSSNEIMQ